MSRESEARSGDGALPPTGRRIPVAGPSVSDREVAYVAEAARTAWYANACVFNERFERAVAERVERRFAISLPSCTSAIHLALAALGVGPGDEVIVPELTWIASAAPIDYVGAEPVFADIDPDTLCLSPEAFEKAITPRTRAVIVVDLYGAMPDLEAIVAIARRHGVAVVEDAAEALGSRRGGRPAGSFGDASVFSFHGSKTVTTGEGGMLVTDDETLYERCLVLRDHGRRPGDRFFLNEEVAFKYKMSALQAAFGLGQVERLDELVEAKRRLFRWYDEDLSGTPGFTLCQETDGVFSSCWMVTGLVEPGLGLDKFAVMDALKRHGIDTRPLFSPLSTLAAYRDRPNAAGATARNPVAHRLAPFGINLPSALCLTREDVAYVCRYLGHLLQRPGKG